jgi:hypothetical protein
MSNPARLDRFYSSIEQSLSIVDSPDYGLLVVPNSNHLMPVHRWFRVKESFSSGLLARVLKDVDVNISDDLRLLDPYAGVGTSCVSAADLVADGEFRRAAAYGVEANGFLHLVASTKLRTLQGPPARFPSFVKKLRRAVLSRRGAAPDPPALSTFHVPAYFDKSELGQLMRLKHAIDNAEASGADSLEVALARVCLGASIEPIGNLRRDGRTLRYIEKPFRPTALRAFERQASLVCDDLPDSGVAVSGRVALGDGRGLSALSPRLRPFNLILFSPPYPNNIDYTEVYKLENWLLGYITDSKTFVQQRMQTVYSHPSVLRADPLPSGLLSDQENEQLSSLLEPLVGSVPQDRYAEGRRRMIRGYVVDMLLTLRASLQRLADNGAIVYVVGNSVHGQGSQQFIIAADLLIAEVANIAGLVVERISVARHLRRRSVRSPYLRESVVVLRRAPV